MIIYRVLFVFFFLLFFSISPQERHDLGKRKSFFSNGMSLGSWMHSTMVVGKKKSLFFLAIKSFLLKKGHAFSISQR